MRWRTSNVEDAFDADDEIVTIRLDRTEEELRLAAQVAMKHDLAALVIEDADVHGLERRDRSRSSIDAGQFRSAWSPPGSDEWFSALIVPPEPSGGPGGACIRINVLNAMLSNPMDVT